MSNDRYNTPAEGVLDWHIPLNENFDALDRDVEIRDIEANLENYEPTAGSKYFATDSGATYSGDGSRWNLVGYTVRARGGDFGHYVKYADGLVDEEINSFMFGSDEKLEVTRVSFPLKNIDSGNTEPDAKLRVYEDSGSTQLLEIAGNEFATAAEDTAWVSKSSPVTVTVTNESGAAIDAVPKVWVNIRR